jgi:hypothetical protein
LSRRFPQAQRIAVVIADRALGLSISDVAPGGSEFSRTFD